MRAGLIEVLPVQCLAAFQPSELKQMFCGDGCVEWTGVEGADCGTIGRSHPEEVEVKAMSKW